MTDDRKNCIVIEVRALLALPVPLFSADLEPLRQAIAQLPEGEFIEMDTTESREGPPIEGPRTEHEAWNDL